MAREQVALLALDWKHWAWCYVASGDFNGEKEAERMGRKGGDWPLPERCEGVRAGAGEGVSLLRRRAPG